jgi:hypothetical protein
MNLTVSIPTLTEADNLAELPRRLLMVRRSGPFE